MKEKLFAFFQKYFPGRRAFIPLLGAASLLATALFLLFPSEPLLPLHATGGGALATARPGAARSNVKKPAAATAVSSRFLNMNVGDSVNLGRGPVSFGKYPAILTRVAFTWRFRARVPGHTLLTVGTGKKKYQLFVFVSPVPSRQVNREDIDWYKSQFGTGAANCGPALVAMSILWARGIDFSVQDIRDEIGFPYDDGAVSFDNLSDSLKRHKVSFASPTITGARDLQEIVNRGHIALLLIQSGGISRTKDDPAGDMVGRYYDDDEGHYILVKGYSLDGRYFVVYDPYPVDWETNGLRYEDDHTMIGKNRYYLTTEIFAALKTTTVLEVSPG